MTFTTIYFALISPIDFWRRWHKTLSSWIHDYVFMPLARSQAHMLAWSP